MGERIAAAGLSAGMFGDIADAQEKWERRGQRTEPKQKWRPPQRREAASEDNRLDQ